MRRSAASTGYCALSLPSNFTAVTSGAACSALRSVMALQESVPDTARAVKLEIAKSHLDLFAETFDTPCALVVTTKPVIRRGSFLPSWGMEVKDSSGLSACLASTKSTAKIDPVRVTEQPSRRYHGTRQRISKGDSDAS